MVGNKLCGKLDTRKYKYASCLCIERNNTVLRFLLSKTQATKAILDKWNYIKLNSFCNAKV